MYSLGVSLAVLLASYIVYSLATHLIHQRKAKALGCQPPHQQRNRLPLGWERLKRLQAANTAGTLPEEFMAMYQEEGCRTFRGSILGSDVVQTAEPRNIQALLATQFKDFDLGELRRKMFFPMLGNGIFTEDGKAWEHSRAMIRPQFVRDQVSDLELEETHVQELLQHLSPGPKGWTGPVNLTQLFFRLTLDSATEFLFGTSVYSQRQGTDNTDANTDSFEWKDLAQSFDTGTTILGERVQLMDFYWTHNPKIFRDSIKEVHRFADFCVQNALQRYYHAKQEPSNASSTSTSKRKYTFLDELVKQTQDPVELRSQLLNMLLAGRDTTASLLSWTFWLLARYPAVFTKLRTRILEDFGTFDQTDKITFASLKSCTYLQHVLNEVLRLYPVVPLNGRRANKDTTLPLGGGKDGQSPIYIKKGDEVGYAVYVMHRMEEFWGADAAKFNPERWVGRKYGWEYLPFNGGPRICLGQQFALTEAGYVIVRLLQRFDELGLGEEEGSLEPPVHRVRLTDAPADYVIYLHETE